VKSRVGSTTRVTDHSREIADDKHRLMADILELSQFPQYDAVAEMNIGAGRINSELHPQWPAEGELFAQLRFANDLGCAPL
jgi:hypothetical protein